MPLTTFSSPLLEEKKVAAPPNAKALEKSSNLQKRFLLFLIGCIGTRLLFVYIAKTVNLTLLKYMGYIALLPAIGFFYIYFTKSRQTGVEVFGDKIWWNDLRPIHGTLYLLFAYHAIRGIRYAWVFLLIDVLFGLTAFLTHHFAK
jgi:hypothetical protein